MKKYFVLFLVIFPTLTIKAQPMDIKPIEGEFHIGATAPLGGFYNGEHKFGPSLGFEIRYNINKKTIPLDFGLGIDCRTSVYSFIQQNDNETKIKYTQSNRSILLVLVTDYNWRQGTKINPFAGFGFGIGINDVLDDLIYESGNGKNSFGFIPRLGLELYKHIRVILSSSFTRKGYNNIGLTVGFVVGGN